MFVINAMKNILIVEDYVDARNYMTLLLESVGYRVYEANNGLEGIQIAKKWHPDLILMDISMPIMDGLEATRIIRKSNNVLRKTPIIAITAFGEDYRQMAINAGCNYLIAKPVDFDELELLLKKYLDF